MQCKVQLDILLHDKKNNRVLLTTCSSSFSVLHLLLLRCKVMITTPEKTIIPRSDPASTSIIGGIIDFLSVEISSIKFVSSFSLSGDLLMISFSRSEEVFKISLRFSSEDLPRVDSGDNKPKIENKKKILIKNYFT